LGERKRLYQSAVEAEWKVSLLDEAHRLTPDAANVLLKVLEEPPAHTALVLMTPFRDRLFSTLISRCQPVRFRPLSDKEMRACLTKQLIPGEKQARLIELRRGLPVWPFSSIGPINFKAVTQAEALWDQISRSKKGTLPSRPESARRDSASQRLEIEQQLDNLLPPAFARDAYGSHSRCTKSDFDSRSPAPNSGKMCRPHWSSIISSCS